MKTYKLKIKKRIRLLLFLLCLCVGLTAFVLLGSVLPRGNEHYADFIHGFQTGIIVSIDIVLIFLILKYYQLLKNQKKLYIYKCKEEDERYIFIQSKSGGYPLYICGCLILFMAVIGAYLHMYIFVSFLITALFLFIVRIVLAWYYTKKY